MTLGLDALSLSDSTTVLLISSCQVIETEARLQCLRVE